MSSAADKVSWFELPADDISRASQFYNDVFGWATPSMGPDAAFALTVAADDHGNPTEPGGINGGFHVRNGAADAGPVINVHVADIDSKLVAIERAGGHVVQPRTEVPQYGLSIALFRDTEGNVMGMYTRQE